MNKDDKALGEWKNFIDNFWDLILLNILFCVSSIPVVSCGAALGALYSSVSGLGEKRRHGGAARMYWDAFKASFRSVTPLWLVILAAFAIVFVDLYIIINAADGMCKYAYCGLLAFAALIIQSFATIGIPMITERATGLKQTVMATLSVLAVCPVRAALACLLNILPFIVLLLSNKAFTVLFLVWICLYFSLTELAVSAMLKKKLRNA